MGVVVSVNVGLPQDVAWLYWSIYYSAACAPACYRAITLQRGVERRRQ
jgi:hypothetical protein